MKAKKILTASISVALALTIASVTNKAWPDTSYHVAKADFGDTVATKETKDKLNALIDKILKDENLTNRYLGTSFFHKQSDFPYYHVSFENHPVPTDVIDTTPWYNVWSEAYAIKTKLDANAFTEKGAQYAITQLTYYNQLYNFETNHSLPKDGFYTTTNFTTPAMIKSGGDGEQDFYIKAQNDNKENIKELFKEGLLGIYKQGQEIEINLVANPDKVAKITSFFVNKVSTYAPNVELGPDATTQNIVAFKVPGELKADQLVVTNMKYIDKNGNEQQTGTFALDIDYSKVTDGSKNGDNGIPKYRENLNSKIDKWLDRARQVNEWLLSTNDEAYKVRREKISSAITELEKLKRSSDANYDKLYKIATPIHEEEDIATLQEVLDEKVAKLLESFSIYSDTTYTPESIKAYKEYIESVPKQKNDKTIKELVGLISELDNSSFKYLKYNTEELEKLIEIAKQRSEGDYTAYTWEKFSTALNHAKDWLEQNKNYHPQIDATSSMTNDLLTSINALVKNDGKPGEQVTLPKKEKKEEVKNNYNITGKFVERGGSKELDIYGTTLSQLIKNIEVVDKGNGKNELIITFGMLGTPSNIEKAIMSLAYNKSGVQDNVYDVEYANGRVNNTDVTYITKAKLLVDADKKDINVDFVVADSWSFNGGKTQEYGDLLLDYSSKVDATIEKKDPLKEQLKAQIDKLGDSAATENYKKIDDKFKVQLEQLKNQATTLLNKKELTKEEVEEFINKLLDEENKLSAISNMKVALDSQKDMYEHYWKNSTDYTIDSIKAVKEKLDALEKKINDLEVSDVEGVKETLTDEYGKTRETLVYKNIDAISNELQNLGDFLRVDTTKLEKEVASAKEKLNDAQNTPEGRKNLELLIAEVETYIKNAKLGPDELGTDDQVNTNLTDYYTEQLDFALQDLTTKVTKTEEAPDPSDNTSNPTPSDNVDKPTKPAVEGDIPEVSPEDSHVEGGKVEMTNLTATFNKFGSESASMMNSVLKGAKYITENGKTYVELELQPMINKDQQPSGVLNKLTVVDNENKEHETIVVEEKEITLTFGDKKETYKYPTKIRIAVDGKPTSLTVNTFANSPVFGTDKHENLATLVLTYPTVSTTTASTSDLQTLYTTATSKYYDSWTNTFKKSTVAKDVAIVDNFGKKINAAQAALKDASPEKISEAYNDLLNSKLQYDLLIRLRQSNTQLLNSFNADKDSGKFTKESIAAVDSYLQERVDKLEELLQNNPTSNEVNILFAQTENYYNLLRYDTSELDSIIKDAEAKLADASYNEEAKKQLTVELTAARDFVAKAKTTYSIQDTRKELAKNLSTALKNLTPSGNDVVPTPENGDSSTGGNDVAPAPGNGDSSTGGNDVAPTPGNGNSSTGGNDVAPTPGNGNSSTGGNDVAPAPGNSNSSTGGNDVAPTPGNGNSSTGGNDVVPTPGNDNVATGGNDVAPTPGNGDSSTGGNDVVPTPGNGNVAPGGNDVAPTPGNGDISTGGNDVVPTPGNGNNSTSGNDVVPTPGNGNNSTGGNAVVPTPGNSNSSTGGNDVAPTPGNSNNSTGGNDVVPTPGNDNVATGGNDVAPTPGNGNVAPGGNDVVPTPGNGNNSTSGNDVVPTPGNGKPSDNIVTTLTSSENGVSVELTGTSEATKLSVEKITDEKLINDVATKLNLSNNSKVRILDLKLLTKDNKVVNNNEKRKVSIALVENETNIKVYHIQDNGNLEFIKSTVENNILSFDIDHFSKFAIVSTKDQTSKTPSITREETSSQNSENSELATSPQLSQNTPAVETPKVVANQDATSLIKSGKLSRTNAVKTNVQTMAISIFAFVLTLLVIRRKNN